MTPIQLVQDDTLPHLDFTIEKDGAVLNLTGFGGVYFSMKDDNGNIKINKQPCVVITPAAGLVRYTLQSGDTDTPGHFKAELQVVDANGKIQTNYQGIPVIIRDQVA